MTEQIIERGGPFLYSIGITHNFNSGPPIVWVGFKTRKEIVRGYRMWKLNQSRLESMKSFGIVAVYKRAATTTELKHYQLIYIAPWSHRYLNRRRSK